MKINDSIYYMLIGCILLLFGILIDGIYLKYSLLFGSIILNVIAIFKNFKEKKDGKL